MAKKGCFLPYGFFFFKKIGLSRNQEIIFQFYPLRGIGSSYFLSISFVSSLTVDIIKTTSYECCDLVTMITKLLKEQHILSLLPPGTILGVSYTIFFNICGNYKKKLFLSSLCRWVDCNSECYLGSQDHTSRKWRNWIQISIWNLSHLVIFPMVY